MKWTIKAPRGGMDLLRRGLRAARKTGGYFALGFAIFLIAVWISLPTRAIAWRIAHEAKAKGILLDIEDLSLSPLGDVTLRGVTWTYAPSRPGQIPDSLYLEEVEVDLAILSLLWGNVSVEITTGIDDGTIHATYERTAEESRVTVDIDELPLYDVPKLRQALNAPVKGLFELHVDLTVPENKFAQAVGTIDIACNHCKVGDGETLTFVPGVTTGIMAKGVTLPEIDFGTLGGRLTVADGIASTEGIETKSDDMTLKLTGSMSLKDPITKSSLEFDLRVLVTEALQSRSEPLKLMIQTAPQTSRLDPPEDEWLAFKLRGTVSRPRFMGIKTKTAEEKRREKREKERAKARDNAKKSAAKPKTEPKPKAEPKEPEKAEPPPEPEKAPEPQPDSTTPPPDSTAPDSTRVLALPPEPEPAPEEQRGEDPADGSRAEGPAAETSGAPAEDPQGGGEGESGGGGTGEAPATDETPPT
ncbi:MAG: type II secretion system protein GspN [Nannocystaceae bacterium]